MHPPAKLNLFLGILSRRPDGFHEIESVMHTIDLCDTLRVERTDGSEIRFLTSGRPCPSNSQNLVIRAAESFFSEVDERFGLQVFLEKKIPLGAGLGGGSADAAGMFLALNHLSQRRLSRSRLSELGAELGSDVPFFFTGGTALATGRGEKIEPITAGADRRFFFVLLYPGVEVPTARVYGSLSLDLTYSQNALTRFMQTLAESSAGGVLAFHNALETPLHEEYPQLADLQERVSVATGHRFHVTGSGSAMFAHVADRGTGGAIMRKLQAMAAGEFFLCESLPGLPGE